ncbi:DUF2239 family protein [Roseiarcaceae bacterium H3SJ34-1]|uniref:DUF2239 family protein n=1 Tax=Terripilifer ovatus TaxID=3032367 RepID=UPI003AB939F0|nr:DUF2239 family protein [Roseiarcaceae bacterium H3SJ34-1]
MTGTIVTETSSRPSTAFDGLRLVASGPLLHVALAVKAVLKKDPAASVLTFDDATGSVIDLDLRGSKADIAARLAVTERASEEGPRGRGRPKLGVVAREVTLLPRHWEWLSLQRGGASHALRRLVDEARRNDGGGSAARAAQERAYRFLSGLAGNLPGFEEASRALFAGDKARFAQHMAEWPADVRAYALRLGWGETGGG